MERPASVDLPAPVRTVSAPVPPPPPPPPPEPEYEALQQNVLTDLPDGMQPNPPSAKLLAKSHRKWKGEYEAGYDGKPLVDALGRPVPVLYAKGGKRIKSRVKLPKGHPIRIVSAVMTVDGWPGKARLNYDIPDLKFIYLSAPDIGTVVVSPTSFPDAEEQTEAFKEKILTVTAGGHEFQLASDKPILGKNPAPASAWVKFDPDFKEDPKYPVMGYGFASDAPYVWPGAKYRNAEGVAKAPPLPKSLQPKMEGRVCVKNCESESTVIATQGEGFVAPRPPPPAPVTESSVDAPVAMPAATPVPAARASAPPAPVASRQAAPPPTSGSSASGLGSSSVKMVVKPRGAKK